ncbi:MAG: ATP-binding protein [Bacteroidota bacterium]
MFAVCQKLSPVLLVILFLHQVTFAHGPDSEVDSLKRAFEIAPSDSAKYETAKLLMRQFFENDAQQGLTYSVMAFDLARKLGKTDRYAFHHNTKGLFLVSLGRTQEAVDEFEQGLKATELITKEKSKANFLSSLHGNLGLAYGHLGKLEQQQAEYMKALEIAESHGFQSAQAIFTNNLSKLYLDLGNLPEAKIYVYKALDIIKDVDIPEAKVLPYLNLGSFFLAQNETDSATKYFEIGLKHSEASGSLFDKGAALIQLSEHLTEQGQYEKAFAYANRAMKVAEKVGNKELLILTDLAMASVKRKMGQLTDAAFCANRALGNLQGKSPLNEIKIYEELEKIAKENKDFEQAYKIEKKIHLLRDTLLDLDRQKYIANAENRFKLDKMRIEGLEKDRQINEQAFEQRNIILRFSLLALFLAIIAAAFLFRNIRQKKRYHIALEKTVKQRTEKLSELNAELEQANFELKGYNRIISHDLKAPLYNIKALLEILERENSGVERDAQNLMFINRSTDQILKLLDDISSFYNFDKSQLKKEKFSLNSLMEEVSLALGPILKERNANFTFANLPDVHSYWTPLFLTFKNLVENGIKYNESDSPEVKIDYREEKHEHVFFVTDNGIGIPKDHFEKVFEAFKRVSPHGKYKGSGLGLSISQKMVREIEGDLLIKDSSSTGTQFEIRFPRKHEMLDSSSRKAKVAH